ncbi:MAG: F0F1 ATP synthase subunit gamma [Robiginitomaculum sp.]|nr:MAG: F0F1 ATP synthase subunit gamma [Robiginitomaculum sp.]
MASLKEFRDRIDSVKSIQKITKAMQMVAAAKLRRAQEAVEAARPYAARMSAVVGNLSSAMDGRPGAPELLVGTGKSDVHLLVVASADRGLCGGFNSQIARHARAEVSRLTREGKTVKILCVGGKAADQLKRVYAKQIIDVISLREHKSIDSPVAADISARILTMFEAGEFDVCTLVFSRFQSVMSQVPTAQVLIPAMQSLDEDAAAPDLGGAAYDYEPDEEDILKVLLPRNLTTQIFQALLENVAGEMGAKMSAMDNSTRNAGEMIDKLSLQYNRKRQSMITTELIEIIAGAEAV